jgi:hypothetical protein
MRFQRSMKLRRKNKRLCALMLTYRRPRTITDFLSTSKSIKKPNNISIPKNKKSNKELQKKAAASSTSPKAHIRP